MKQVLAFILISFSVAVIFCGCSKERIEQSQVKGTYAIKYPYPNIVLELKNGKCVELYFETQDGISFKTTDVQTVGRYPSISYSCSVEGETSGACNITAVFNSPDRFLAEVGYYVSKGEGLDAIKWAGNIEKIEFNQQAE